MGKIDFDFITDMKSAKNDLDFYEKLFALHHDYDAYIKQLYEVKKKFIKLNTCYNCPRVGIKKYDWTLEDVREQVFKIKDEWEFENCFQSQRNVFLTSFKEGESLSCTHLNSGLHFDNKESIFLLPNKDTLLIIENGVGWGTPFKRYFICARLLDIGKQFVGRKFIGKISHYSREDDDWYEECPAFEFVSKDGDEFHNDSTYEYLLTDELALYDGIDIRDILTPMSFEEIAERLKETKEKEKEKYLTLLRKK